MAIKVSTAQREIHWNGKTLEDLNPKASVAVVVKQLHAAHHPELATANIEGPVMKRGTEIYTVNTALGKKG